MSNQPYTSEQLRDAAQLADALVSVHSGKRTIFALMLESMMIGAELAEKKLLATEQA